MLYTNESGSSFEYMKENPEAFELVLEILLNNYICLVS